jgi:membrane protease YdiL (CAAX protease family)
LLYEPGAPVLEIQQLRLNLESYLILLAATALPAAVLWFFYVRPQPLLPPQRHRYVAWGGPEILLLFFLVMLFWPAVADWFLSRTGFLRWLYGPEPHDPMYEALRKLADDWRLLWTTVLAWPMQIASVLAILMDDALRKLADDRRLLWTTVLAWPMQIASVLAILHGLSGAKAYQLGLSFHNLARDLLLGWIGWAVFAPVVLCCHIGTDWIFRSAWGGTPEEHPLLRIFEASPLRLEWIVIIASATILAPVLEELLFRGVLQRWFAARPWGGGVASSAALVFTLLLRGSKMAEAWQGKDRVRFLHESAPVFFASLMIAVCWAFEWAAGKWLVRRREFRAIYGTALLFAMFHASVWPTPIPLFLLAIGLGYLAYRTQSVVGPIVMHVLFNTIACIALFLA